MKSGIQLNVQKVLLLHGKTLLVWKQAQLSIKGRGGVKRANNYKRAGDKRLLQLLGVSRGCEGQQLFTGRSFKESRTLVIL